MHAASPPSRLHLFLRQPGRSLSNFGTGLVLWIICTGYQPENRMRIDLESWVLGVPAALLFAWFRVAESEENLRIHIRSLPGFLCYFLFQSFRTGVDVAYRALHPEREINPGFCTYASRLPEGSPRALFANMISVLPGTLSWSLVDGVHKIHLLAGHPLILEDLCQLEARVGRLYGLDLPEELF